MNRTRLALAGVAVSVALVATVVVALGFGRDEGGLAADVFDLDGRATRTSAAGEESTLVTGRHQLAEGDRLEVVEGTGVLGLDGGATLELRAGRGDADASEVELVDPVALRAGDALLVAPTAARVEVGGTEYGLANGAARLARTTGSSVGVYAGEVGVSSGGRSLPGGVPALREATVAAVGSVPTRAEPLDYDPTAPDPWDLRFLGAAIDLGEALEARSLGFTAALPAGTTVDVAFLARTLPGLEDEADFVEDLLDPGRAAGELLVGAAIADAGTGADFASRWSSTFAFRSEGAQWGIVALDQGVRSLPLLGAVDGAIDGAALQRGPADLALGAVLATRGRDAASSDGGVPIPGTGTGTGTGTGATTPAAPPTTAPPQAPPPPGEVVDAPAPLEPVTDPIQPALEPLQPVVAPLAPLIDPAEELLGGLLGGEDGSSTPPPPPPTSSPLAALEPIVEPVIEVVDGVAGLLGAGTG